jgi:hypothetical protein
MPLPSCAHGNGLPYYSGYAAFLLLLFERVKTADTRHQCVPKKPQFQIRNAGRTDKRRVPDQFATGGRARWILAISNRARQAMLVWYAEGAGARTCRRHAKAGARDHRHRAIEQPLEPELRRVSRYRVVRPWQRARAIGAGEPGLQPPGLLPATMLGQVCELPETYPYSPTCAGG